MYLESRNYLFNGGRVRFINKFYFMNKVKMKATLENVLQWKLSITSHVRDIVIKNIEKALMIRRENQIKSKYQLITMSL